jgi:hypothetical protein
MIEINQFANCILDQLYQTKCLLEIFKNIPNVTNTEVNLNSLIKWGIALDTYVHIWCLIDKEYESEDWKTISICQFINEFKETSKNKQQFQELENFLIKEKILIQKIKNKRNKLLAHLDMNICLKQEQDKYIEEQETKLSELETFVNELLNLFTNLTRSLWIEVINEEWYKSYIVTLEKNDIIKKYLSWLKGL